MALREIGALRAELVEGADDLEPWRAEWDRLAIAAGRPYCAPAWMLAWWHHVAPPGAELRVVLAIDEAGLAGIAPFFRDRGPAGVARYRLLGIVRAEPLARPGMEAEAARLFATALAGLDGAPDLIRFEGVFADSAWPRHLAEAWPGRRPWLHRAKTDVAPTVALSQSGFDAWFAGKSRNFRQQMRRARRQLEERGAALAMATSEELPAAVDALASLHRSRWEAKQGGSVLDQRTCRMLVQAGRELQSDGRFRLWSIRAEDRIVSAHLFVAAGGEVAYWLGGFDEAWAAQHPSLVTILAALEHAWGSGDRRVDLGWGGQPYKYRFADGEDRLAWWTLIPPGPRSLRTRVAVAPAIAMRAAGSRLPSGLRDRVKRAVVRKPGR